MLLRLVSVLILPLSLLGCSRPAPEPSSDEPVDELAFEVTRDGHERLEGVFTVGIGQVELGASPRTALFAADVALPDDRLQPDFDLATASGTAQVRLALDGSEQGSTLSLRSLRERGQNRWRLHFADDVPLDLRFEFGAARADLAFTGQPVERLSISAGVAPTRLAFDEPNAIAMERLSLSAGASSFQAERLGNARVSSLRFDGGAGSFLLDFGGEPLAVGGRGDIAVGVGRLRVRLPQDAPVVLVINASPLARISVPSGYVSIGDSRWHSPAVGDPDEAFSLHVNAGIGALTFESTR